MLHLFTGLPGSMKTANMLHYVRQRQQEKGKGSWAGRPVYFYNIRGCAVDGWTELSEDEARRWYELPEGSIILLDEAQRLFRPVNRKDQVAPREITELETHRHHGFDIFMTTQHPMLIHTAVRRQVQMHWHIERPFGLKSKALKWEKCISDPDDHFARKDAQTSSVSVPKDIFSLYTSTVLDTQKKRIPRKLFYILGAFLLVVGGFVYFVTSYAERMNPQAASVSDSSADQLVEGSAIRPAEQSHSFTPVYPLDPDEYNRLFEPRIPGRPATAPVYDELQKPVIAPRTLCFGYRRDGVDHCECVTQQMTPIDMSFAQCKKIVNDGLWDATLQPARYSSSGNYLGSAPAAAE